MFDTTDVIQSLKESTASLKIHWGRDPVLLVDEIDKICTTTLQRKASKEEIRNREAVVGDVVDLSLVELWCVKITSSIDNWHLQICKLRIVTYSQYTY